MTNILEGIVQAAARVGSDGRGKNGFVGYLTYLARRHPTVFAGLIAKVIPLQLAARVDHRVTEVTTYKTVAEVKAELVRRGIDLERLRKQLH